MRGDDHRTGRQKILDLLRPGNWVSAYECCQCSLKYSARISELRREGHIIENRVERHGRQIHGYFRLTGSPPKLAARPKPPQPTTAESTPSLFGDLRKLNYPD